MVEELKHAAAICAKNGKSVHQALLVDVSEVNALSYSVASGRINHALCLMAEDRCGLDQNPEFLEIKTHRFHLQPLSSGS
jgi:hypothetical protein